MFPPLLLNSLWHSTSTDRYKKILESGAILQEPEILDCDRWGTIEGKEHYPLVRHLGGISLFDFHDFDEDEYSRKFPVSSWSYFVPGQNKWTQTVWIKIDRSVVAENLMTGAELMKKWKDEELFGHPIMPYIECAHIGPLPTSNLGKVLLYDTELGTFKEYSDCPLD